MGKHYDAPVLRAAFRQTGTLRAAGALLGTSYQTVLNGMGGSVKSLKKKMREEKERQVENLYRQNRVGIHCAEQLLELCRARHKNCQGITLKMARRVMRRNGFKPSRPPRNIPACILENLIAIKGLKGAAKQLGYKPGSLYVILYTKYGMTIRNIRRERKKVS